MQQGTTEQRLKQSNEILKMKVAQLEAEIVMHKTKIAQLEQSLSNATFDDHCIGLNLGRD